MKSLRYTAIACAFLFFQADVWIEYGSLLKILIQKMSFLLLFLVVIFFTQPKHK